MDIRLLKSDILSNNIPKFLIFKDNEHFLVKQYLHSMSETLGKACKFYDDSDAVIYDISVNLKDDCLYVVQGDDKIIKNPMYLKNLSDLQRNIVVIVNDTSAKHFQDYNKYVVNFDKLDRNTIYAYLIKTLKDNEITIDEDRLFKIIDFCKCDLSLCVAEIDKIIILGKSNSNLLVDYMLKNSFPDYRCCDTNMFVKKLLTNDRSAYDDCNKINDNVVTVAFMLYRMSKNALQYDTSNSHYYDVLRLSIEVYDKIISGKMSDSYALNYLMYKCFS